VNGRFGDLSSKIKGAVDVMICKGASEANRVVEGCEGWELLPIF
jgi:hypothetical protein